MPASSLADLPRVTVYSTTWCGSCRRLKRAFDENGIAYVSVDIDRDETAAQFVEGLNHGNRTVPTVVIDEGKTAMTNPSVAQVVAALDA